jgi:hypothetical protein
LVNVVASHAGASTPRPTNGRTAESVELRRHLGQRGVDDGPVHAPLVVEPYPRLRIDVAEQRSPNLVLVPHRKAAPLDRQERITIRGGSRGGISAACQLPPHPLRFGETRRQNGNRRKARFRPSRLAG